MFLPSEAVYAELHANFPELVREGFAARVWIVSPTTCMATLNTMRAILKDARMREQAGAIRKTLRLLHRDVELVVDAGGQAGYAISVRPARISTGSGTAAETGGQSAPARLDNFDFEELDEADRATSTVVPLTKPDRAERVPRRRDGTSPSCLDPHDALDQTSGRNPFELAAARRSRQGRCSPRRCPRRACGARIAVRDLDIAAGKEVILVAECTFQHHRHFGAARGRDPASQCPAGISEGGPWQCPRSSGSPV